MIEVQNLSLDELKELRSEVERLIALRTPKTAKRVIFEIPVTDNRHKNWAKVVTAVDTTKTDGYAFKGDFIRTGTNEATEGSIIIHYYGEGSVKNHTVEVDVYRLTENGLELLDISLSLYNRNASSWALLLRDKIADLLK